MKEPSGGERQVAYGAPDFRRAFGIGNTKMHEEINAGRLKVRYLGRKLLIMHDDAIAWLTSLPERVSTNKAA